MLDHVTVQGLLAAPDAEHLSARTNFCQSQAEFFKISIFSTFKSRSKLTPQFTLIKCRKASSWFFDVKAPVLRLRETRLHRARSFLYTESLKRIFTTHTPSYIEWNTLQRKILMRLLWRPDCFCQRNDLEFRVPDRIAAKTNPCFYFLMTRHFIT